MKFGSYIRKVRECRLKSDKSFSLRGVARRLKLEPSYLSKIERDEVPPMSAAKLIILANILHINADELLARARKIPPDLEEIIFAKPKLFASVLRQIKDLPDEAVIKMIRTVTDGDW